MGISRHDSCWIRTKLAIRIPSTVGCEFETTTEWICDILEFPCVKLVTLCTVSNVLPSVTKRKIRCQDSLSWPVSHVAKSAVRLLISVDMLLATVVQVRTQILLQSYDFLQVCNMQDSSDQDMDSTGISLDIHCVSHLWESIEEILSIYIYIHIYTYTWYGILYSTIIHNHALYYISHIIP